MKKTKLALLASLVCMISAAQQPSKAAMEKMLNESLKDLDPATRKKMMDAMNDNIGKPMPANASIYSNFNSKPVIPVKDVKRISALPKNILSDAELSAYLKSTISRVSGKISVAAKELSAKVIEAIKIQYKDNEHWGMAAGGLWILGENEAALAVMGKAVTESPANPDILNGYACFLIQNGGGHLALPILENMNRHYPGNSTILNNIGQAWFELGDLNTSARYLDSTTKYFPRHSQANFTKAVIEESKGEKEKAVEDIKKSIQESYSPAKAVMIKRLGGSIEPGDINFDEGNSESGYSLGKFMGTSPDFYYGDKDREALIPKWADYIQGIQDKKREIDDKRSQQNNPIGLDNRLMDANIRPGFLSAKANARLSAVYEQYIDFQSRYLKEASEMDMMFNDKSSHVPAMSGQGGSDKCEGVGEYKAWAYQYNQQLQQFRIRTLTQARQFIEEMVFLLRYASLSDEVFQLQKQQLENDFIGYCAGLGTTPFDFQPGCVNCDMLITQCTDSKIPEHGFIKGALPDFDVINCTTHGAIPFGFGKYTWDCNIENVEINVSVGPVGIKGKYTENWVKGKFNGNVEVVGGKKVGSETAGPVKIEAVVKGGCFITFTDKGISDAGIIVKAGVKAGADVPKGRGEVVSLEGRMGWNSGPSLTGGGLLSGL